MKRYRKYRKFKKFQKQLIVILLATILGLLCLQSGYYLITGTTIPVLKQINIGVKEADTSLGWNLILVNKDNRIPDDYEVDLIELSNGEKVDSRIYPQLQEMFDNARAVGLELFVREGYRTADDQQEVMTEQIQEYIEQGYSRSESKKLAKKYVAAPGTSEHQLGISVDINADTSVCSSDAVYTWLAENAYKYGFIKRYPSDKTDITGVYDEPWHYRYVGEEAAREIQERGLCLEEYIEQLH